MTGNAVQYVESFLIVPAVQIIGCRLKPDGILILALILVGALLTAEASEAAAEEISPEVSVIRTAVTVSAGRSVVTALGSV